MAHLLSEKNDEEKVWVNQRDLCRNVCNSRKNLRKNNGIGLTNLSKKVMPSHSSHESLLLFAYLPHFKKKVRVEGKKEKERGKGEGEGEGGEGGGGSGRVGGRRRGMGMGEGR